MTRGVLITFEGTEGSGKSTHARRLVTWLRRKRIPVVHTHEPGGTAAGHAIRQLLLHAKRTRIAALTEVYLFMASRAQLVEEIIQPALHRRQVVVCDRFLDATMAYQGGGSGVATALIRTLARPALRGVQPDLTFLLDVPPSIGFRRLGRSRDRMEAKTRQFHQRVHRAYQALARQHRRRIVRIDTTVLVDDAQATIRAHVQQRLRRYQCSRK